MIIAMDAMAFFLYTAFVALTGIFAGNGWRWLRKGWRVSGAVAFFIAFLSMVLAGGIFFAHVWPQVLQDIFKIG